MNPFIYVYHMSQCDWDKVNYKKRGKLLCLPQRTVEKVVIWKQGSAKFKALKNSIITQKKKNNQLISILHQNHSGRKFSNCTDFKEKTKLKKKKNQTALKEKKNNTKWKRTHVKEVFPRTALCTAARGRPRLLGDSLGIDIGGGFSRRSHMWFPFRHAVDVQGSCNKETDLLFLLIMMLFMLSQPVFHREVPLVHS